MNEKEINDKFKKYEEKTPSDCFISTIKDYRKYDGASFKIIRRLTEEECDIECMPMWKIQFDNGDIIDAFSEEIFR